jgi:hypothetical protein
MSTQEAVAGLPHRFVNSAVRLSGVSWLKYTSDRIDLFWGISHGTLRIQTFTLLDNNEREQKKTKQKRV